MKDLRRSFAPGLVCTALMAALLVSATSASACNGLLLNFDNAFSGPTPSGSPAWFSAVFQDVSPGEVQVTISAVNLQPGQEVGALYLNLNPNLRSRDLHFRLLDSSDDVMPPIAHLGVNEFNGGGSGKYDMYFQFSENLNHAFIAGDHMTALITGIPGLTSADFAYLSSPGCTNGPGPFYGALELETIPVCGSEQIQKPSTWVGATEAVVLPVPEPTAASFLLLLAGLLGGRRWLAKR